MAECALEGCPRTDLAAKGLCWMHYQRKRRTGSTADPTYQADTPLSELIDKRGPDECWEYQGPLYPKGYGRHGRHYAHRLAWSLANGREIPDEHYICHHCDNPPCCNPRHLYLGTASTNAQDRERRGRSAKNLPSQRSHA